MRNGKNQSILVTDTPNSCSECEINCPLISEHTSFVEMQKYSTKRHPQCPLKQLPSKEKLKEVKGMIYND